MLDNRNYKVLINVLFVGLQAHPECVKKSPREESIIRV